MAECYFCGVSEDKEILYDAVSNREIVKICEKCSLLYKTPVINKPSHSQLNEADRSHTVYERLYRMAGLDEHKKQLEAEQKTKENLELKKKEAELGQIIEKNMKDKSIDIKQKDDLVNNFHWTIMMARRRKGLSQKQLAEEVGESETTIRMAEKAILPKEYSTLIDKLEKNLGLALKKRARIKPLNSEITSSAFDSSKDTEPKIQGVLDFESRNFGDLKIDDLKKQNQGSATPINKRYQGSATPIDKEEKEKNK